jgi:hypothetical protein
MAAGHDLTTGVACSQKHARPLLEELPVPAHTFSSIEDQAKTVATDIGGVISKIKGNPSVLLGKPKDKDKDEPKLQGAVNQDSYRRSLPRSVSCKPPSTSEIARPSSTSRAATSFGKSGLMGSTVDRLRKQRSSSGVNLSSSMDNPA